jgi:1,4-alpha-glucan branching enzyme
MHDSLEYISKDPIHRAFHHHQITFGLLYAFTENFVLPYSHDEVVHGKGSMLGKMPGDEWRKRANLRLIYGWMWAHPGKKLIFMGSEFGQWREWNHDASLDWHLLDTEEHRGIQHWVRDLNRVLRDETALHEQDFEPRGFEWIDCQDSKNSVLSFVRWDAERVAPVVCVYNFTPVPRSGYRVGVPIAGRWRERLNSDARRYGGSGMGDAASVVTSDEETHGHAQTLVLTLPPLAALFFIPDRVDESD